MKEYSQECGTYVFILFVFYVIISKKTLKLTDTDLLLNFDETSLWNKVHLKDITSRLNKIFTSDLANLVMDYLNF